MLDLLEAVHHQRDDLALASLPDAQIRWAVSSGLGPLLLRSVARDEDAPASPYWSMLQGADLAAQVLAAAQSDATAEIIDACQPRVEVTLLKGISLADRDYPSPHLRPMRDLDLLVPADAVREVQRTLLDLGYREQPDESVASYDHHAVPVVHPRTGIWVDVHHRLFPPERLRPGVDPYRPDEVTSRICPSSFRGRRVNRLTDELQVAYIASHWALSPERIYGGGGMVAMLDLIYLLKRAGLRWAEVLGQLEGSRASAHLYLLLGYLQRSSLVEAPPGTMERLARMQPCLGGIGRRLLDRIIDRYVVDGRDYGRLARPGTIYLVWQALLGPGPPLRNLARVPWTVLERAAAGMQRRVARIAYRT